MKDWNNLIADENLIINKHFTAGRGGHKIQFVVLHHNAGNLTIQQCWNTWQTRQASAHYQVQADGKIGQLVHDKDTAWHAGNLQANYKSIGIEHADSSLAPNWAISEETLDNGAHLVAAICKAYGLGRPTWGKNVFPHKKFSSTACPASLAGSQNASYMARAQAYYDSMTGSSPAPASSAATPASSKSVFDIDADGYWGPDTNGALQTALGTPVDRVVSSQPAGNKTFIKCAHNGWEWVSNNKAVGSSVILAAEKVMKADGQYNGELDGIAGTGFANGICLRFNGQGDSKLDDPSLAVKRMQTRLRDTHKF